MHFYAYACLISKIFVLLLSLASILVTSLPRWILNFRESWRQQMRKVSFHNLYNLYFISSVVGNLANVLSFWYDIFCLITLTCLYFSYLFASVDSKLQGKLMSTDEKGKLPQSVQLIFYFHCCWQFLVSDMLIIPIFKQLIFLSLQVGLSCGRISNIWMNYHEKQ